MAAAHSSPPMAGNSNPSPSSSGQGIAALSARRGPGAPGSPDRGPALRGPAVVLELLRPGSFVKLHNQPQDLPPFQLIRCRGGRCWVRQQAWGQLVQWEVAHRQLTTVA
jgi:hypothetical protein